MKTFEIEKIHATRDQFAKASFPKGQVEHKGVIYPFFVLPPSLCPQLQNFAMRVTPSMEELSQAIDPSVVTLFGVSSDVPEAFRALWVLHEVLEFCHIGPAVPGRCGLASQEEICLVKATLSLQEQREYLLLRSAFFQDLLVFTHAQPSSFEADDVREFIGSLLIFDRALARW